MDTQIVYSGASRGQLQVQRRQRGKVRGLTTVGHDAQATLHDGSHHRHIRPMPQQLHHTPASHMSYTVLFGTVLQIDVSFRHAEAISN